MKKDLAYYRSLPYTKRVDREEEDDGSQYYIARIVELDGCLATGDSRSEALAKLNEAFDEYIEAMLEWGNEIFEPTQGRPKARGGVFKWEVKRTSSGLGSTKRAEDGLLRS